MKLVSHSRTFILLTMFVMIILTLFAVSGTSAQSENGTSQGVVALATEATVQAPTACPGELPIVGKGPNEEAATPLAALTLTDADIAKIKSGTYKAAIAMHYLADDWPQLQVKGITETLEKYGIKVIATTDGEMKAEKQIADIESLI